MAVADESILDQALSLIPGMGTKTKRTPRAPSREKQLSSIQTSLAKLTKDVEKLAKFIGGKSTSSKSAPGKRTSAKTRKRSAPTAKRPVSRIVKAKGV
jgi:hypothetical protein